VGSNIDHNNKELVNLIDEYKLNHRVHLVGERNDIPLFMNSIDLLVLCSSYGEAFPNVLNEAMSCGTPCVTTNIGDSAAIVGNTGWVIPPNNSNALAKAINKALEEKQSNQKKWMQRKKDCRHRVINNFSLEMMTKKYLTLWADGIN
jgi:glycosyltransferase involved in cell wall biosynthesis